MATASEIPKERIVRLHGEIDDESARRVIAELLFHQMQNPNAPITLDVDSPGGSMTASFAILDTMAFVKCPIRTECRGTASGCAMLIVAAGTPGQRKASRDATFGYARSTAGSQNTRDAKTTEVFLSKMNERLISALSNACKQQRSRIIEDLNAERHFTVKEAMEYGLLDGEVSGR